MPVKIKKEKKIKQKQKQVQKQVVNIKIGDVKRSIKRKVVTKKPSMPIVQQSVQPVQYMYQSSGSAPIPQFQNIGIARQAQANILAEQPQVRLPEVREVQEPLQIGGGAEPMRNLLGGAVLQPEDIRRQRELRLQQPVIRGFFEPPIEEEVNIEPLQVEEENVPVAGAVGGGVRRYIRGDGYGTKAQIVQQIYDMNMGYTKGRLKKNNREELINILLRLLNVKR